jgi:hypothetical protein
MVPSGGELCGALHSFLDPGRTPAGYWIFR